ncbi:MAG: aminopeptidase [Planctomycetes bacterium]|nr:aminopeptidase [Planctomycetota bacterium]
MTRRRVAAGVSRPATRCARRCLGWRALTARAGVVSAAAFLVLLSAGCRVGYVLEQAGGQLHVLQHRVPLERALASPSLSPAQKSRVQFILTVKEWGRSRLGLVVGKNYTRLYDTHGRAVAWNLVACRKDGLEPLTWWFPVVGSVPYLGFFDAEDALLEKKELERADCDTCLRPVAAYSSLGWFEDPIFTPMLRYDDADLAGLILHECVHGTVYFPGRTSFNETFAEFVADHATPLFLEQGFGPGCRQLREWQDRRHDQELFLGWLQGLRTDLERLYRSPLTRSERVQLREDVYLEARVRFAAVRAAMRTDDYDGMPPTDLNNAFVAAYATYHTDTRALERVLEALGGGLRPFLEAFRNCPSGEDPMRYARKLAEKLSGTARTAGVAGRAERADAAAPAKAGADAGPALRRGETGNFGAAQETPQ